MACTIAETFQRSRLANEIALMPFVPAGYPDLQTTTRSVLALQDAGANLIEIGFPYSDPVADGPVIQEAFTHALEHGVRVKQIIESIASIKDRLTIPLAAMLSYSVVFRYGLKNFVDDIRDAGFGGIILPDLPPPEAQRVCEIIRAGGLDTILLVAPTTSPQRRIEIARLCSGFVYYLSVAGITGERSDLPGDVIANVRELKALSSAAVCVGFGIHRAQQVDSLKGVADGAIVGSAFVRRMKEHVAGGPDAIALQIARYCKELKSGSRK